MMRGKRGISRRGGASIAETAIAIPILFLLLFGLFEYGRFFLVKNLLANAAREGARFAVVHTNDKTTADVQAVVQNFLGSQQAQVQKLTIQVYSTDANADPAAGVPWTATPFGSGIGVQVDADYKPIFPVVLFSLTHVRAVAVMNCEGN
jgi:Flp pilus assembly protein TadG